MDQSTPESSTPLIFKDRAEEIIKLINQTGSDLSGEEPTIKGNDSNTSRNSNSFEFWTYCDEEPDFSIMDGAEGNGIGARSRPAKAYANGTTTEIISSAKGPLIIDPEVCQKEKIEKMEVILDKKIKKSFYYTIIDSKKQLWERRKVDDALRSHMGTIGSGRDLKYYCKQVKGHKCDIKDGQCSAKGRSDHVLNHIRGQLGFAFDCFYCDAYQTANTQHFKKHFVHYHWSRGFNEVQMSRKKSTKSADSDAKKRKKKTSSKESEDIGDINTEPNSAIPMAASTKENI